MCTCIIPIFLDHCANANPSHCQPRSYMIGNLITWGRHQLQCETRTGLGAKHGKLEASSHANRASGAANPRRRAYIRFRRFGQVGVGGVLVVPSLTNCFCNCCLQFKFFIFRFVVTCCLCRGGALQKPHNDALLEDTRFTLRRVFFLGWTKKSRCPDSS